MMFIIKIVSSTLIPIALYVSYIMLMARLEKLYKDDDFDRYRKYAMIGNTGFALLTMIVIFVYNAVLGYQGGM